MSKLPKLSQRDINLIVDHCDEMISQADSALFSLRSVPKSRRNEFAEANIQYWINFKAAMKSTIHQAKMRLAVKDDVISPSV